jgi:hypothetical protein
MGNTWKKLPIELPKLSMEAAFAASNTNIIVKGSYKLVLVV